MRIETRQLYRYEELSEKSKTTAREWFSRLQREWFDSSELEESFKCELEELGYPTDDIGFSLNYSQGDGVAFYGVIDIDVLLRSIKKRAYFRPLFNGADPLVSISIARNSYGHHYSHWNAMQVDVEWMGEKDPTDRQDKMIDEIDSIVSDNVKKTSRRLESIGYSEIEHENSDDVIAENIAANEYEFLADGSRP